MSASRTSTGSSLCPQLYDEDLQIGYCLWVKCWLDNRFLKLLVFTRITESCAEIHKSVTFRRFAPDPSLRLPWDHTVWRAGYQPLCSCKSCLKYALYFGGHFWL